MRVGIGTL